MNLAPELMSTMAAHFGQILCNQNELLAGMNFPCNTSTINSQMMIGILTGKLTPKITWSWSGSEPVLQPPSSSMYIPAQTQAPAPLSFGETSSSGSGSQYQASSSPPMPPPPLAPQLTVPAPAAALAICDGHPAAQLLQLMQGGAIGPTSQQASPPSAPPTHMSKNLNLVADAWREYDQGLAGASLKSIYEAPGWSWSGRDTERRYWRRREPLIRAIERLAAAQGQSPIVVASTMDENLRGKGISLHALAEQCKKGTYTYEP